MMTAINFKGIYERYLSSGLSVRSFCHNEGMQEARFYYWQKKLAKFQPNTTEFVPLVINNTLPPAGLPAINKRNHSFPKLSSPFQEISCEISYPDGTTVKLTGYGDYELLSSLVLLKR
jgi:hypothetical protein